MENRRDEHVIYIKDLLFAVLYQWRKILICALVLALVLGGYRGFTTWKTASASSSADISAEQAAYQQQKNLLELEIIRLEERIQAQSTYIAETPFMALNPHNIYTGHMYVYMHSNNAPLPGLPDTIHSSDLQESDSADALLQVYRAILLQSSTLDAIAAELQLENKNMTALVDVNCDLSSNLMTIIVRQADQESAELVMDLLQSTLENAQKTVTAAAGPHSVSVLSRSIALRNDQDLATLQDESSAKLLKMKESLMAKQTELKNLAAPAVQSSSVKSLIAAALKFAVLGALLGSFAVAAIACLAHLARSKVYSSRTLVDQTGLHVLGCIPSCDIRCPVDRSLRKFEQRCCESADDQSALVAARIRNVCSADAKLLIAGSCSAEARLPLLQALENAGINVSANGDLLRNADVVAALSGCDGVVLVEQCGQSRYEQILQTMEQVTAMGKTVIGCVLIDG